MREVLQIGFGNCGNSIAYEALELIAKEHCIKEDGSMINKMDQKLEKSHIHFEETHTNRFVPRSLLVDLDPVETIESINKCLTKQYSKLLGQENVVYGKQGASNNWAVGHYTEGAEMCDNVMDKIRRKIELCDKLQGIQIVHSLMGGTGSGLGTLIIGRLREHYCDRIVQTHSIYPSASFPSNSVESYNATLSIHTMIENCDMVFCYDNKSLFQAADNISQLPSLSYNHPNQIVQFQIILNRKIAQQISNQTASMRFPGQLNGDLRKMSVNLTPFPRMHFYMSSLCLGNIDRSDDYVSNIIQDLHNPKSFLIDTEIQTGTYRNYCGLLQLRGQNLKMYDIEASVKEIKYSKTFPFADWIPNNYQLVVCQQSQNKLFKTDASFVLNSSAIQTVKKQIAERFTAMFRRKSYLHWYTGQGMDEMEFTEAESNMNDLVSEYWQGSDAYDECEEIGDESQY